MSFRFGLQTLKICFRMLGALATWKLWWHQVSKIKYGWYVTVSYWNCKKQKTSFFHSKLILFTFLWKGNIFECTNTGLSSLLLILYRCCNLCYTTCNTSDLIVWQGVSNICKMMNYFTHLFRTSVLNIFDLQHVHNRHWKLYVFTQPLLLDWQFYPKKQVKFYSQLIYYQTLYLTFRKNHYIDVHGSAANWSLGQIFLTSIQISLIIFLFFIWGFQKRIASLFLFKKNKGYMFLKA